MPNSARMLRLAKARGTIPDHVVLRGNVPADKGADRPVGSSGLVIDSRAASLDHMVGKREQRWGYGKADPPERR